MRRFFTIFGLFIFTAFLQILPQEAFAENWIIDIAGGYMGEINRKNKHVKMDDYTENNHGFDVHLHFGYRILPWLGISVSEDLGKTWHIEEVDSHNHFYSTTALLADFYLYLEPIELTASIGPSVIYHGLWYWKTQSHPEGVRSIETEDVGFGFRTGFSATYIIKPFVGVGFSFDYTFDYCSSSQNTKEWSDKYNYYEKDQYTLHLIDVLIHTRFMF